MEKSLASALQAVVDAPEGTDVEPLYAYCESNGLPRAPAEAIVERGAPDIGSVMAALSRLEQSNAESTRDTETVIPEDTGDGDSNADSADDEASGQYAGALRGNRSARNMRANNDARNARTNRQRPAYAVEAYYCSLVGRPA